MTKPQKPTDEASPMRAEFEAWADSQGWDNSGPFRRQMFTAWKGAIAADPLRAALGETAVAAILAGEAAVVLISAQPGTAKTKGKLAECVYEIASGRSMVTPLNLVRLDKPEPGHD